MPQYFPKFLTPPKFKLIGHRGVRGLRPENTMLGFELAKDLGLNWIEFDVRLTKCNSWVVMHDATVDRTTNYQGLVRDKTLAELKTLQNGLWFAPPYKDLTIPTLSDVIAFSVSNDIYLNIEVKIEDIKDEDIKDNEENKENNDLIIQNAVKSFVDCLKKYYPSRYPSAKCPTPLISSFNLKFLQQLKNVLNALKDTSHLNSMPPQEDISFLKDIPIGYIVDKIDSAALANVMRHNFATIHCDAKYLNPKYIKMAHNQHTPILAYTVNTKQKADELISLGIDGIFTDRPDLLNNDIKTKLKEITA